MADMDQYMKVQEGFAYHIPHFFSDSEAAPLLCVGAIGYQSLRLTDLEDGLNLGLTGFEAYGHHVLKLVRHQYPNTKIFVFARSKKEREIFQENLARFAESTSGKTRLKSWIAA